MPQGVSHVSLATGENNYKDMCEFYVNILKPVGYKVFMEKEGVFLGMSPKGGPPDFWLHPASKALEKFNGKVEERGPKTHIAFYANSRKQVDEWHQNAMYVSRQFL